MHSLLKKHGSDVLVAGVIGELAFEIYAWLISPVMFDLSLSPLKLVTAIAKKVFGIELTPFVAFSIHVLIGVFVFSSIVLFVQKLSRMSFWFSGFVAGLTLWFIAQGILAPFIGRSFMMDFGAYTQSSFIGHVGMCLIMAAIFKWCDRKV